MKIRRWVVYLCIALAVLGGFRILLIEWRTKQAEEVQTGTPPSASSKILNAVPSVESAVEVIKHDIRRSAAEQKWRQRLNGPVEFYGRVLDQDGNPVAGARLSLNLSHRVFEGTKPVVDERIELVSDFDGRFKLEKPSGHSLRILDLTRDGYLWTYPPGIGSFDFSGYRSKRAPEYRSPAKAFAFHLWKKGEPEPTVGVAKVLRVEETDIEFSLNLLSAERGGERIATSDLRIRLRYVAPDDPARKHERELTLEAPTGGLIETQDTYIFEAPASGYASQIQYVVKPTDLTFGGWKRKYYLRSRDGRLFAGFEMAFTLFPHAIELNGSVNPNGSRHLEPDPAKQITDPEEIRRLDETTRP